MQNGKFLNYFSIAVRIKDMHKEAMEKYDEN